MTSCYMYGLVEIHQMVISFVQKHFASVAIYLHILVAARETGNTWKRKIYFFRGGGHRHLTET